MEDQSHQNPAPRSWLLMRPAQAIMALPLNHRWEFTRRHPYYLQFWERAAKFHRSPGEDASQRTSEVVAVKILGAIGFSELTAPVAPQLGVEMLGMGALGAAWQGGAVAPASFRTLAGMLLAALPPAQRCELGRLLTESAEHNLRDSVQMAGIYERFAKLKDAVWDSFPDAPIISVNLQMPQRAISEAVEQLVRQWKAEREISERRRRDDSIDDYLAVWDLREGWADRSYSGDREKTFQAIAQQLRIPVATATSRYRSAFRLLSGHDYTPELWIRLMGPLKLANIGGGSNSGLLMHRPWRSPHPRPVTEAVLLPGRNERDGAQFLEAAGVTESDIGMVDLALDVETLLERGRTDEEILRELELGDRYAELILELRRRHDNR